MNRVATKGNLEHGHVSTAEVYSEWVDFNTSSSESMDSIIDF